MGPIQVPAVKLNRKFLEDQAEVSLDISAPGAPALMAALRDGTGIPAGRIVLADVKAKAGGNGTVTLGQKTGKVAFSAEVGASFSVGIYPDPAGAIQAIAPAAGLSRGLQVEAPGAARYLVVRAAYDISGAAKGSVALGAVGTANFGVSGSSQGLFAVLHRFEDKTPAMKVFQDAFGSWALPRQVDDADDLKPGTWIIAEVDGSVAVSLGVQAGYDFSWIREIAGGELQGNIGMRVQLGASAAFGFQANGRYALVLGRETSARVMRLRLYKLAKKGWDFALDARLGLQAQLPPFFAQKHKAEDLVAAILGLHNSQLVEDLRETRAFVNSNVSLNEKLAGVLMELGGVGLQHATGLSAKQIEAAYEKGRARVVEFLGRFDSLGHDVTSMLLSLTGQDFGQLETALKLVAATSDDTVLQGAVRGLLSKAGFDRTPFGRFAEAAVGAPLKVLNNTDEARKLRQASQQALDLLTGKTLQELLGFFAGKLHLDRISGIANQTDFDSLDNWLKARLAAFLGQQQALLADLEKVQAAVKKLLAQGDRFYELALENARKKQEFALSVTYARSTTRTALVDVSFDLSVPGNLALMRKAIDGDFADLLLHETPGVTIAEAELTHNLTRNVSTGLSLPFGAVSSSAGTSSTARLRVAEDNGRVLVYELEAGDEASERFALFRARSGRDSSLTLAAAFPLGTGAGVKVWKESACTYSYRMERAVRRMRVSQLEREIGPLVTQYVPAPFAGPEARAFPEFVADLDKLLDGRDPNSGTHDIGDTLVSLTLSASPEYLRAWSKAPADRRSATYMGLSRALQAKLKELVAFACFSDPARYGDINAAAPPVVYAALPPSTSIELDGAGEVRRFDTGKDVYWNQTSTGQIAAVVSSESTKRNLERIMNGIAAVLRGIPGQEGTAKFYDFNQLNYDRVIAAAMRRIGTMSLRPELLGSLLDLEQSLVENAVMAGVEMAQFRETAGVKPAEALRRLSEFGLNLARTFNSALGNNVFFTGVSRPLGTLLFMEAARAFEPALGNSGLAALLKITVVRSGKLEIDDMLGGKIDDPATLKATPDLVLFDQPFVQG